MLALDARTLQVDAGGARRRRAIHPQPCTGTGDRAVLRIERTAFEHIHRRAVFAGSDQRAAGDIQHRVLADIGSAKSALYMAITYGCTCTVAFTIMVEPNTVGVGDDGGAVTDAGAAAGRQVNPVAHSA
ncbi:hypothetical protein D3C76_1352310 [compost metagenome]